MKHHKKYDAIVFLIFLTLLGTSVTTISSISIAPMRQQGGRIINGQILFSPLYGQTTYLIDNTGSLNHTWPSSYTPGAATYWLENGTILRTIRVGFSSEGGAGGGIQKVTWGGTVTWDFRYNTGGKLSHHDIKVLPNGNILVIAWETKTMAEAVAAGRDPAHIYGNSFMPEHVIEVHPTGPTSGDIVWEWHVWDHLIQDFDSLKANYGIVGDHPELVNINYGTFFMSQDDWLHANSIDYNPQFDQIILSIHNFNEIWVIDHSTTTEEAAGHTGGNSEKGGDLLYRWGNPAAYDRGTSNDQKLFGQHDTNWIKPSYPGAGHILIFNNGNGRPGTDYSEIDEIAAPVDDQGNYYLEPGAAYGPENLTWSYAANPPSSFYAYYISSAERLKDGDTLICDGVAGKFFEVTPDKVMVWQWTNPYPYPNMNDVFKIVYIPPYEPPPPPPQNKTPDLHCEGNLSWTDIPPEGTIHGSFQVTNIGEPNSTLNWTVDSYPDWGTWSFTPASGNDLTPEEGSLTVQVYITAPDQKNTEFQGYIRVVNINNASDFDLISVYLTTPLIEQTSHTSFQQISYSFYQHLHSLLFFGMNMI
jgi:hypothetical protein